MSAIGNKEVFAKNLMYYVKRSGKDQKVLAEIVGVSPSTFNEWTKAKKYPRIDKIEILANYFGILKSDLIEEKNKETNSPDQPKLTEGEEMLLKLFRQVPEKNQAMVLEMIRAAVNTQL